MIYGSGQYSSILVQYPYITAVGECQRLLLTCFSFQLMNTIYWNITSPASPVMKVDRTWFSVYLCSNIIIQDMNYIHGLLIVMFDIVCLYLDFVKNWSGFCSVLIYIVDFTHVHTETGISCSWKKRRIHPVKVIWSVLEYRNGLGLGCLMPPSAIFQL